MSTVLALVALLQAAAGCGGSATAFVAGGAAVPLCGSLLLRCGGEASARRGLTRVRGDADNAGRQLIRVVGAVCLRDGLVFMAQRSAHKVCPFRTRRAVPRDFMWQGRGFLR
jgi:hypothetical protein